MKPEIVNLRARMMGMPLNKYQMALSKMEFVKLLDYVAELEQLRIHDVMREFHCERFDFGRDKKCEQQCSDCHWMKTKSQ